MPRKRLYTDQPRVKRSQKQKQKQKQSQSVVVHIGSNIAKRIGRRRRAPRAPKQTIEEAEYISALNRTMPSVQINPIPATQQPAAVPILQSEQLASLSEAIKDIGKERAYLKAQREISIREGPRISPDEMMDRAPLVSIPSQPLKAEISEKPLKQGIRISEISDRPPVVSMPSFPLRSEAPEKLTLMTRPDFESIPLMSKPRGQEVTTIISEPSSNIHMNALSGKPVEYFGIDVAQQTDFPKPTLPASIQTDSIVSKSAAVQTGSGKPKYKSIQDRIAEAKGVSKKEGKRIYNEMIAEVSSSQGVSRGKAARIIGSQY